MSDLQQLEQKVDRLTVLVECLLRGETLHEVTGYAYGRTGQGQAFILLYGSAETSASSDFDELSRVVEPLAERPATGQGDEVVCRVDEADFGKLPAFINTAVPEPAQNGRPTRDQARQRGIYTRTPVFTIATVEGQGFGMGICFSRVVDVPGGSAGPGQRQQVSRPHPPTPPSLPAAGVQRTAENQKPRWSAVNGDGSDRRSKTAETQPIVKSAEHWRREAKSATKPLLFDTAVSRLEPWFKDANSAGAFRESLFGSWQQELAGFYLEALLRYAKVRQVLDGRHPSAHLKARVEALNTFNRLRREVVEN